ncbi:hypothetical protein ACHAXS_009724 [Conticribra weissflogii]
MFLFRQQGCIIRRPLKFCAKLDSMVDKLTYVCSGSRYHWRKDGFVDKVEDDLKDYLFCEIQFNSKRAKVCLRQSHLLVNLE